MSVDSAHAPRLRDRMREETSRAILSAAEEVFAQDGLAARMEGIAARAGVAVGTLYNHFEDREALLGALTGLRCEALLTRVDAALAASAGRPLRERLAAYLSAIGEHARAHGRFLSMLVQAGEGPARPRSRSALASSLVRRMETVLGAAAEAGEVRPDDARVFAPAFVAMVRGILIARLEEGAEFETAVPALIRLFVDGVRA